MADSNNTTCAICGKGYKMCLSCDRDDASKYWKLHCDTPEHYKIFQVIHGYTCGLYTKEEAARKLERIDLSDFDELRDSIKKTLNEIRESADAVAKKEHTQKQSVKTDTKRRVPGVSGKSVEDAIAAAITDVKTQMPSDRGGLAR